MSHEIAHQRMANQRLAADRLATPEAVVRWLVAVQAQEYALARWSVGLRAAAAVDAVVERALAEGKLLRTHVLRPTWHFVLPEDIHWLLQLTSPHVRRRSAYRDRQLELTETLYARTNTLLEKALGGGRQLTRAQLSAGLGRQRVDATGSRLGHILMRAELDGVICSGARSGRQHTYALLAERAPRARSLSREEALGELTLRYFASRGPATLRDFVWWSGLGTAEARHGLALAASHLQRTRLEGREFWLSRAPVCPREPSPSAHLLQGFDEYVIAYSETRHVLDTAGLGSLSFPARPPFTHALIIDGQAVGRWRHVRGPRSIAIELQPARPLSPADNDALRQAAERYARFAGVPVTVRA